jgi:hypothetical protein
MASLAPHIGKLGISVYDRSTRPSFDDDLLSFNFEHLEILERHWGNLEKFPNANRLPRLTYYSESRQVWNGSQDLNLLKNIDHHLEKLQLLALRAQCAMDTSAEVETHNINRTYSRLRQIRNQRDSPNCLIQAPVEAPTTKESWLYHAPAPVLWFSNAKHDENLRRWYSERLELLRKADPQSKFAETRGEDFRAPFAPHPLGMSVPFGVESENA